MAEGRVRNTGTGLKSEYMLTDHQGNVRISFEEQNGKAVVRQDNGYYPFGLIMAGSTVPSQPNRNLYNGGSEWQNDFADLPDYYKTHFRNYDAAIGRFIGIDIRAEENPLVTPNHYRLNNPVYFNDPLGDKEYPLKEVLELWNSPHGGMYGGSGGSLSFFTNEGDAFQYGASQMDYFGSWGMFGFATNFKAAERIINNSLRVDKRSNGREDYIVAATWYYGADGKPKLQDGLSGDFVKIYLKEEDADQPNGVLNWTDVNSFIKNSLAVVVGFSDFYLSKRALNQMPKWLVGSYNRAIVMEGAKNYTSFMSIQLRRLGWKHGGRIIQKVGVPIMIGTTTIENAIYYNEIIETNPSLD